MPRDRSVDWALIVHARLKARVGKTKKSQDGVGRDVSLCSGGTANLEA